MKPRLSDIEIKRKQALAFGQRAYIHEELGCNEMAELFRHLVTLCDLKISILTTINENPFVRLMQTPDGQKKWRDWKPGDPPPMPD